MSRRLSSRLLALALTTAALAVAPKAHADRYFWQGYAESDVWSTSYMWNWEQIAGFNGPPPQNATTDLYFHRGDRNGISVNDIADNFLLRSISFFQIDTSEPAYSLSGKSLRFAAGGSIVSISDPAYSITTHPTVSNKLVLDGAFTAQSFAGSTLTLSGAISSVGSLVKTGAGTVTLSGGSSYTGGTTINEGRLIVRGPGGNYVNNAELEITAGDYNGVISGPGGLEKTTSGILFMGGKNTYSGQTFVRGGTLVVYKNDSLPTSTALIINSGASFFLSTDTGIIANQRIGSLYGAGTIDLQGGTLTVDGPDASDFSGTISGTGNSKLVKAGIGTLTLFGTNTYAGGTTVNGGRLVVFNPHGNYVTNAALEIARSSNLAFAGAISGTGSLVKTGSGTLTLTGATTYTGGTFVEAGRLVDATPTGSYTIAENAFVEVPTSDNLTASGAISGEGSFVKKGAGTLTLTGSVASGVKTQIEAGTLKGAASVFKGNVAVSSGATLQLDQTRAGIYNGIVSGAGSLLKTGSRSLTLANAPAVTGGVRVSGGSLIVGGGGTFGGGLTVDAATSMLNVSDATLTIGGRSYNQGEVYTEEGSTTVFTGLVSGAGKFTGAGTLRFDGGYAPGNSPAAVTVAGNLVLGASNDLTMELGGSALGSEYDHLIVNGTAFLDGSLTVVYLNGFSPTFGQSFDLFDFSSSNGTFASVSLPTLGRGLTWDTSRLYSDGSIQAVPEPSAMAALAVGALTLLRRRRK